MYGEGFNGSSKISVEINEKSYATQSYIVFCISITPIGGRSTIICSPCPDAYMWYGFCKYISNWKVDSSSVGHVNSYNILHVTFHNVEIFEEWLDTHIFQGIDIWRDWFG